MPKPDIFAPLSDLGAGDALESWRWLTGNETRPRLVSAMGDIFIFRSNSPSLDQPVHLLDTYAGQLEEVGSTWQAFKDRVANPDAAVADWFKYDLLCDLVEQLGPLAHGQCFSPYLPPCVGGTYELENFHSTDWRVHMAITGQICFQCKDLPAGTPIKGFNIEWE